MMLKYKLCAIRFSILVAFWALVLPLNMSFAESLNEANFDSRKRIFPAYEKVMRIDLEIGKIGSNDNYSRSVNKYKYASSGKKGCKCNKKNSGSAFAQNISSRMRMALDKFKRKPFVYYNNFSNSVEKGVCSYYSNSLGGKATSTGIPYKKDAYTAASRTFPLMSVVTVKNVKNGREIDVIITDRGPYVGRRILDVSMEAAKKLGFVHDGLSLVIAKFNKKKTMNLFSDGGYYAHFYPKKGKFAIEKSSSEEDGRSLLS